MASKLRAKILAAKDIKSESVTVPEWDVTLEIRGLSAAERGGLVERATVKERKGDEEVSRVDNTVLTPLLIIASCFDPETNERVFEDEDLDPVNGKSASAIDAVTNVVLRLNGMNKDEQKAIAKNSVATVSADSASV